MKGFHFSFPANLLKVTFLSIQSVGIEPQGLILLGNTFKKEEVAKKKTEFFSEHRLQLYVY